MKNCVILYGNTLQPTSKTAGPFRIATELRKNGYTVNCIDLTVFNKYTVLMDILRKIISKDTLWIGISSSFMSDMLGLPFSKINYTYNNIDSKYETGILKYIDFIKDINPNIEFISGGSKLFQLEKYGFKVFEGYVDKEILEFTQWCENKSNEISYSLVGSEFKDFITSTIEFNDNDIIAKDETLPIEISRGCIFRCKFCSFPMNGKTKGEWIKKDNILLDEFNSNYEKFGTTNYIFADDTYNDSVDKVKRLYDNVFSKLNFKIDFTSYLRLDLMMRFPETVDYLKESGLKSAVFGIETLNARSAKAIGKGVDPNEQIQFAKELKQNQFKEILIGTGLILGLPYDNIETLSEMEEFLFSDKNYFDVWDLNTLSINPKNNYRKQNYSEFDLEYEKYGYEVFENRNELNAQKQILWKNYKNGLTHELCSNTVEKILTRSRKSKKFKFGLFRYPYYRSLGIPHDDLLTLSQNEIFLKYDIEEIKNQKKQNYIDRLKSIYLSDDNNSTK